MSKFFMIGVAQNDEELLTIKALRVIKKCDIILCDTNISYDILNNVKGSTKLIECNELTKEIIENIKSFCNNGLIVGRIVIGDPYEYADEIDKVIKFNEMKIDFEIVPAMAYPISVLNSVGIPLCNRGKIQDFHVFYINTKTISKIDWRNLSQEKGVSIFYGKGIEVHSIVEKLLQNGKNPEENSAVIVNGTRSDQYKITGQLCEMITLTKKSRVKNEYVLVIGEVVKWTHQLAWLERKPLHGLNISIIKPHEHSGRIKEKLKDLGAEVGEVTINKVKECPEILKKYLGKLHTYKHIIFTSVSGVNIFFDYLLKHKYDIRKLSANFIVVGKSVKKAIENRGVIPFVMCKSVSSFSILQEISLFLAKGETVLIPCSKEGRSQLSLQIEDLGLYVDRVPIYESERNKLIGKNQIERSDIIIFTTPTSVAYTLELLGGRLLKKKKNITIGLQSEKYLKERGFEAIAIERNSTEEIINKVMEINNRKKENEMSDKRNREYNEVTKGISGILNFQR